ncbi:hypothetical protein ACKVV1_010519 [Pyricularia oryzae]
MEVPWDEAEDGPMPEWMKPKAWYLPEIGCVKSPDGDYYVPYNKGGACPIDLGMLLNERYRVAAFAGIGGYAMVWLAIDEKYRPGQQSPKYVAIKILRGSASADEALRTSEEASLRRLMEGRKDGAPGSNHIIQLLDAFTFESPNGHHRCLVLEQAGQTFAVFFGSSQFGQMIDIFRQCAAAVAYMHSMGIIHGDLDVSNVVASVPDCSALGEDEYYSRFGDLETDHPKKKVFDDEHQSIGDIRLIDFGESFTGAKRGVNTHRYNTPPEIIKDEEATYKADIWSLGCMLWHLWFGSPLMHNHMGPMGMDDEEEANIQRAFLDLLALTRAERKEILANDVEDLYGHGSANEPDLDALLELILDCTQLNPEDRPTANEIVSSRIWEEKVLPAISGTTKNSPDGPTGAAQPSREAESASRQTITEVDVLERSQNEDLGADAAASGTATPHSNSPEAPQSSAEPVCTAPAAVAAANAEDNDKCVSNPQEKKWKLWWPLSIVQDWFRALWNWRSFRNWRS